MTAEEILLESPIASRWKMHYYIIPGLKYKMTAEKMPDYIIEKVLKYKGYESLKEVVKKDRTMDLVYTRQLCFYFLREETRVSWKVIAEILGGRDHTTAIHGAQKIEDLLDVDEKVQQDVKKIKERL